jgi:hypothetical protein
MNSIEHHLNARCRPDIVVVCAACAEEKLREVAMLLTFTGQRGWRSRTVQEKEKSPRCYVNVGGKRRGSKQIITDISWRWPAKPGLKGLVGPENFQARALGPLKPGVGPGLARACGARLGGLQGFRPGRAKHYSARCAARRRRMTIPSTRRRARAGAT